MKCIAFYPEKCDLCRKCEIACTEKIRNFRPEEAPSAPHIRMFVSPTGPVARICHHCEEPPCVDACIGESLYVGPESNVCQDVDRCIGCFMCNMVCPHAAVVPTVSMKKALKCTLACGKGSLPACVISCDRGALVVEEDGQKMVKKMRRNRFKEIIKR
jgi:carbon-monoxide dehydrogenase iron sulfur subunit